MRYCSVFRNPRFRVFGSSAVVYPGRGCPAKVEPGGEQHILCPPVQRDKLEPTVPLFLQIKLSWVVQREVGGTPCGVYYAQRCCSPTRASTRDFGVLFCDVNCQLTPFIMYPASLTI